jgi:hypothetical protein
MGSNKGTPAMSGVSPVVKSLDFAKVSGIPLDSVNYGKSIEDRLKTIDDNFASIVKYDYLRGNDGASVNIKEWVIENDDSLLDKVVEAIAGLDGGVNDNMEVLKEGIRESLVGKKLYLIYKEEELISSLPFTFIDPRFADLTKSFEDSFSNIKDLSCIFHYDQGEFKAVQSFPTIYYDSSISGGELCWLINGTKTGLPCRGPRGENGVSGKIYTVVYNDNVGEKLFKILGAIIPTGNTQETISNTVVKSENFSEYGIDINPGNCVIGVKGTIDGDNVTLDQNLNNIAYIITNVYVTNEGGIKQYYIVNDENSIKIPHKLTDNDFQIIMENTSFDLKKPLKVSDSTTLKTLNVSESTTLNTLNVSGDTTLNKLKANGDTTLDKVTTNKETVKDSLEVKGSTTLNKLKANGDTTLNNVTAASGAFNGTITAQSGTFYSNLSTTEGSFQVVKANEIKSTVENGPINISSDCVFNGEDFQIGATAVGANSYPVSAEVIAVLMGEIECQLSGVGGKATIIYPNALFTNQSGDGMTDEVVSACIMFVEKGEWNKNGYYLALVPTKISMTTFFDNIAKNSGEIEIGEPPAQDTEVITYAITANDVSNFKISPGSRWGGDGLIKFGSPQKFTITHKATLEPTRQWVLDGKTYTTNVKYPFRNSGSYTLLRSVDVQGAGGVEDNYAAGYSKGGYKYIIVKTTEWEEQDLGKTWVDISTGYDGLGSIITPDSDSHFNDIGKFVPNVSGKNFKSFIENTEYYCHQFSLNGVDLIGKILELENRVKQLENKQ